MTVTGNSHRRLVDTRHGQVHVRLAGAGSGTPLLLVHSQIVSGRWYDQVIEPFSRRRLVVVPDRIGYGGSDKVGGPLGMAEYANITIDVLDALGIDRCDAVGIHSGGIEVIELATAHADRIRRAVACTVIVFTDEERAAFKEKFSHPPPDPSEDGSHLLYHWEWLLHIRPPGLDLSVLQGYLIDHLVASPDYWWTFNAAFDYPVAETVSKVRQPFLVLAPHDDLRVQMQRAIPMLPAHAEVIEMPHIDNVMSLFTLNAEETVGYIESFLE